MSLTSMLGLSNRIFRLGRTDKDISNTALENVDDTLRGQQTSMYRLQVKNNPSWMSAKHPRDKECDFDFAI